MILVSHSGLITVMERAARKAAPRLRRDFNEVQQLQVSRKGPADFVSKADMRAERAIYDELLLARPDWGFVMEEAGVIDGKDGMPRWAVATPALTVTRPHPKSMPENWARISWAKASASEAPQSTRMDRNSSPPNLPERSVRRVRSSRTPANARMTRSPSTCPCRSFTDLK